jgi:hypothetical protein
VCPAIAVKLYIKINVLYYLSKDIKEPNKSCHFRYDFIHSAERAAVGEVNITTHRGKSKNYF